VKELLKSVYTCQIYCKNKSGILFETQCKVVHYLSIGAISSDLERPPNPQFRVTPIFDLFVVIFYLSIFIAF